MSMRWVEFGKDYAPFMKLEIRDGTVLVVNDLVKRGKYNVTGRKQLFHVFIQTLEVIVKRLFQT